MQSLTGLKAIDIVELLSKNGYFQIGSYNKPICTVLPVGYDDLMESIIKLYPDHIIMKRPKDQSELTRIYRALERSIQNE